MKYIFLVILALLLTSQSFQAQKPLKLNSNEIMKGYKSLIF